MPETTVEYKIYGHDDCGYYQRVVSSEAEVQKIVKTGTVQKVLKTVTIQTKWLVPGCGDYSFPSDWKDDSIS